MNFKIAFAIAPDPLIRLADEVLRSSIRCSNALRRDVRAVAKAYIDEADELKRTVRDIEANVRVIQIESRSPKELIEKARSLRSVPLPNEELQEKVRKVAASYVMIAEKNQQLFDEFKEK